MVSIDELRPAVLGPPAGHTAIQPRPIARSIATVLAAALALTVVGAPPASARVETVRGSRILEGVPAGDVPGDPKACSSLDRHDTMTLDEVSIAMRADVARATHGVDGRGVDIAVVDTGVMEVSGLQGQVVEGVDLSFDQRVDDLRGQDLHGHGTAMASIAAGRGGASGDGVAPGARIIDVRAGAADGSVDVSQVIAAIDWVIANRNTDGRNIRVLNLAYNTDGAQPWQIDPLSHAVDRAWRAGIVVVVAGGNDGRGMGRLGNPALNPTVIAVGAAEDGPKWWKPASWSSTGDGVRNPDVVAPGNKVLGAGIPGSYLATNHADGACAALGELYMRGSGSSQAAAAVSGAVALMLEARPGLTPDQVKHLLRTTARSLDAKVEQQGRGMVDVATAMSSPVPGIQAIQPNAPATGLGSLDAARGSMFVGPVGDQLRGEVTAFGTAWDPTAGLGWTVDADPDGNFLGATWSGATWSGATWSGATWSGATWSGATWSGATWSGATWSGATWSGATWSGATWSGATWSGAGWTGASWTGASWTGASWTGASWTGASWT